MGGTSPYTFAVTTGTLPTGLNLTSGGLLSGAPTTVGSFNFTVTATDSHGCTGSQNYSVIIGAAVPPPAISSDDEDWQSFRIIVNGSNLQNGIRVYVNNSSTEWSPVVWKNATKVVIKGGAALKAAVPKNTSTNFTFMNPDGGWVIVVGWSW